MFLALPLSFCLIFNGFGRHFKICGTFEDFRCIFAFLFFVSFAIDLFGLNAPIRGFIVQLTP